MRGRGPHRAHLPASSANRCRSPTPTSTASTTATRTSTASATTPCDERRSHDDDHARGPPEVWFLTGSQGLYGDETLRQVADQSQRIARALGRRRRHRRTGGLEAGAHRRGRRSGGCCLDANADDACVGVIAWMHTFSPAKMWIAGLDALAKPLLHLHTQANVALPWATHRHGLHEPQPGRARRPRVRLHPDPPRRRPQDGRRARQRPGRASAGSAAGRGPRVGRGRAA